MQGYRLSHGLWEASAPEAPPTQRLAGRVEVDVVGIGGSGRNVGLVNAGMLVAPEQLPGQLGPTHGARLLETLGHAPTLVFDLVARHGMDCQALHQGALRRRWSLYAAAEQTSAEEAFWPNTAHRLKSTQGGRLLPACPRCHVDAPAQTEHPEGGATTGPATEIRSSASMQATSLLLTTQVTACSPTCLGMQSTMLETGRLPRGGGHDVWRGPAVGLARRQT